MLLVFGNKNKRKKGEAMWCLEVIKKMNAPKKQEEKKEK